MTISKSNNWAYSDYAAILKLQMILMMNYIFVDHMKNLIDIIQKGFFQPYLFQNMSLVLLY
ncbi:unnamed protein product [Paramecium primaurelia]|uniref:Uncharacterized protein n=1 Tax=Paramecium primaurelia TaxID=5886 RepID=A0A8S1LJ59_PARPR|nr:unnamed protein product [Paramecium primaurelia]